MSKIAVIYWSGTGNTEKMAESVLEGIKLNGGDGVIFTPREFDLSQVDEYTAFAFGCSSQGAEELETSEFQPMWDEIKSSISSKKVGLFGSYGWGDGEWMRNWEEECVGLGIKLVEEPVICNEAPDDTAQKECIDLGRALA